MLRPALALLLLMSLPAAAQAQFPGACTGTCSKIAGTGEEADDTNRGDDGPAVEAAFDGIDGLDYVGDGSILVADGADGRVRRITPGGHVVANRLVGDPQAVVGTGWFPTQSFGHPFVTYDRAADAVEDHTVLTNGTWRTSTMLEEVLATDVEAGHSSYYVAEPVTGTVWNLRYNELLQRWTSGPALEGLDEPEGIGGLPSGGFLVAQNGQDDCTVRRHDGKVMAGVEGACIQIRGEVHGDGGPATEAVLRPAVDVEATPDGGFVIAERERLRRVDAAGKISTLYVTGIGSGDFPAPEPSALDVTEDGDVLLGLERVVLRFDTNFAPPPQQQQPPGNPLPPPPGGGGAQTPVVTPKLTAALAKASYKVKKGKKLAFKFTASAAGDWKLAVRKGKKVRKAFRGKAKPGANAIRKKIALKPGRYTVTLTVAAGGTTAKDTAKLRVVKR